MTARIPVPGLRGILPSPSTGDNGRVPVPRQSGAPCRYRIPPLPHRIRNHRKTGLVTTTTSRSNRVRVRGGSLVLGHPCHFHRGNHRHPTDPCRRGHRRSQGGDGPGRDTRGQASPKPSHAWVCIHIIGAPRKRHGRCGHGCPRTTAKPTPRTPAGGGTGAPRAVMAPVGTPQGRPLLSPAMLGYASISSVRLGSDKEDAGTDARGPRRNPPLGPLPAGAPAFPGR